MSNTDIKQDGGINIWMFHFQHTAKPPLTFKELKAMEISDPTCQVDLLWDISLLLGCKRPAWSGMMQTIHKEGNHPGKSSVLFLPMIDMDPSNLTCISSTLWYVCDLAKRYGVNLIITFDHPLYWKALIEQVLMRSIKTNGGLTCHMAAFHAILCRCQSSNE